MGAGLDDRLHQPYRAHLIPGMEDAFQAAKKEGAYNAIISGAGSTLMAYVPVEIDCDSVGRSMSDALAAKGLSSIYHVLDIDTDGAIVF